jgi:RNA polymerase sigma-B factor
VRRLHQDRLLFERYEASRDPVDRDAVVERFLPLARHVASRYADTDESFEDVYQVACLALVGAVDRFDPDRHTAFSSYAVPTMAGAIKRYFRDQTWAVHVPRNLHDLGLRVQGATKRLTADLGRAPTVPELAAATQASEAEVVEALQALGAYRAVSLEAPDVAGEGRGHEFGDKLGFEDEGFDRSEQRATIDALLRCLTREQRRVVRLRFEHDLSQRDIGEFTGVSQTQVSRILRASLTRLKDVAARRAA